MAERGLSAPKIPPTTKSTRAKVTEQAKAINHTKGRDTSQRNPPKKKPPKQNPPLEPQVVVVPVDWAQKKLLTIHKTLLIQILHHTYCYVRQYIAECIIVPYIFICKLCV